VSVIESVRGMRDVTPAELDTQAAVAAQIEQVIASYGYRSIDLPIIERRDLYLRKLGEELVGKIFEFSFSGRELALRPEWTASVLRAYVARMQDQPLPLRLRYSGPVFRNERPQRHTYRQFTQIGGELIGAPSPRADAECLSLACAGLVAAGLQGFRVRIGHIGLVRQVLGSLGLSERAQSVLAWSLERMRKQGPEAVREQLRSIELGDGPPLDPALIAGLDDAQAEALLLHALRTINVNLRFGTRPPEAIVGRLVRKLRRGEQAEQIERAIALLDRLCRIQGPPATALPAAAALLDEYGLPGEAVDELRSILELAVAQGLSDEQIIFDFGLGRGLNYYTGMIFEIYDQSQTIQLCGGGRYDDLVMAIGGRQLTPAIGFAYGLERVVAALGAPAAGQHAANEVLVAATESAAYTYALEVASTLRQRGWVAQVDVRGRSSASNLRDADRRGLAAVALVGPDEHTTGTVTWRDLRDRSESRLGLAELPSAPDGGR
jgi:histidyl-tRNA synthetase